MFSKLLKYDLRSVMKYWWLGGIVSLAIAVIGGICIRISNVEYTAHHDIQMLGVMGTVLCYGALWLLPIFTTILVLIRFYKHFFTDEGYLTFTLPVKRKALIDSKLLMGIVFMVGTYLLIASEYVLMWYIGEPEIFTSNLKFEEFLYDYSIIFALFGYNVFNEIFEYAGAFTAPYAITSVLIVVAGVAASLLLAYVCISFASAITKKHKVIAAIGIYYGVNSLTSLLIQLISIGGFATVSDLIDKLPINAERTAVLFVLIGVLGILTVIVGGLYQILLYLLDKKLNLE